MADRSHDITVSNLLIDLQPQAGEIPFAPVVHGADVSLTSEILEKVVAALLVMTKEKQPVDIELASAAFVDGGAAIEISAGLNRFLKAKATAELTIEARDARWVAVSLSDLRTLGKIPIEGFAGPAIEKALASATEIPGVTADSNRKHGVLIEPNAVLAHFGVPLTFADGGGWTVVTGTDRLTVGFGPDSVDG